MLLTRRTNVLLDEANYATLLMYSQDRGETIGELIRQAIKKTYKAKKIDLVDKTLIKRIMIGWKLLKNPEIPVDYKALVEYGRKY